MGEPGGGVFRVSGEETAVVLARIGHLAELSIAVAVARWPVVSSIPAELVGLPGRSPAAVAVPILAAGSWAASAGQETATVGLIAPFPVVEKGIVEKIDQDHDRMILGDAAYR
jgi:hypothetical protein